MADDGGRGNVLDLPLVRLFSPPEARPPEGLTPTPPAADGFPALPAAPAAVPPESLSLPAALVPSADDESPPATMLNRAVDPNASRNRNAAATAMVVAAAIAVACLRGAFGVVEYVKARAEHHRALRDKGGPDAKGGGKGPTPRIPPGPEFGRGAVRNRQPKGGGSSLGSRSSGTGGRSPGGGSGGKGRQNGLDSRSRGRKGSGGSPLSDAVKESRKKAKRDAAARERDRAAKEKPRRKDGRTPAGSGGTAGPKSPKTPKTPKSPKSPKSPKDKSGSLTPASNGPRKPRKNAKPGKDRRTLPQALGDEAARRAKKRLKKRRKDPDPPVLAKVKKPKTKKSKKEGDASETPKEKVDLTKKSDGTKASNGAKDGAGAGKPKGKKSPKGKARRTHAPGGRPGSRPWRGRKKPSTGPKKKRRRRSGRHTRADRPWENREGVRDMPDPDGEWLKPPPGWTVTTSYTVTQDGPARRHPWPEPAAPAAVSTGVRGLPRAPENGAGPRPGTTRPIPMPSAAPAPTARPARGGPVTAPVPVRTTQYADSDLTIHDVIEADADMAEEILAGADRARDVAGKCDEMSARLEELYAKVQELKVPGVLAGMVLRLMEQAGEVKNRAQAVATTLPRASEAISQAGANAERRHRPLSDITKDMGHVAPAERDYHKE